MFISALVLAALMLQGLCLTLCAADEVTAEYDNPIISGFHPDPSVCRDDQGRYLIVCSSFHYFPGVPIYESWDMKHWRQIGNVLDRASQLPLEAASSWLGIYAPTIRYNDGVYYMITTNVGNGGNFMVTATDPRGPWSEPLWLEQEGIDPSLLFDDGRCYMVSNPNEVITLCEIDPATGATLSPSREIWRGTGLRHPEGPHIYKKDGWYYLLISEGGTELAHGLTMARARDIYGPYEACPRNPIFTHCNRAGQDSRIQGTGHGDLVQDGDGQWWMVMLAYRQLGDGAYHHLGRETFLAPVEWDSDGWLVVNGGQPLQEQTEVTEQPRLSETNPPYNNTAVLGFGQTGPEWLHIQNADSSKYELLEGSTSRPWERVLRMHGSRATLSQGEQPTFLGRRQEAPGVIVETWVEVGNLNVGDEAGLTIYQIYNGHAEIAVRREADGSLSVVSRATVKSLVKEEVLGHLTGKSTKLGIVGTGSSYVLLAQESSVDDILECEPLDCALLSTEVVGGFTGVTIGMYVTGSGSADFCWFDYEEMEQQ